MKLFVLTSVLWGIFIANTASAQQLTIRSGEHGAFSRLVIPYPPGTGWSVAEKENGVSVTPDSGAFQYDTREIFNLIQRNRISDVRTQIGTTTLFVSTTGAVHYKAFQLSNGAVVLDVIDGSSKESSHGDDETFQTAHIRRSNIPHFDVFWRKSAIHSVIDSPQNFTAKKLGLPDGRVAKAEKELLLNFSRATAQGIFSIDPLSGAPRGLAKTEDTSTNSSEKKLAMQFQTIIDRDLEIGDAKIILPSGASCLADSYFDLTAWMGAKSPLDQISELRRKIATEFDRDNNEALKELVQVYLALGFGEEAASTLGSANFDAESKKAYSYIASVFTDPDHPENSSISTMVSCNGKVALWAFLGHQESAVKINANISAIQAAFSALPYSVRLVIGPNLVRKLLSVDERDAAYAIRNSLERNSSNYDGSLGMAQAALDMSTGELSAAEIRLRPIAMSNSSYSAAALVEMIDARLKRGRPVDKESIQSAAALAQELGVTEEGLKLRRSVALGYGSVGDFDRAFSTLNEWPPGTNVGLQIQVKREIYEQLLGVPDDELFLRQVLYHKSDAARAALPSALQIPLARRMIALGFPRVATELIDIAAKRTPEGKLVLAQASLSEPDPAAAIAYLEGLDGDLSDALRADALAALGEHVSAADLYLKIGNTVDASKEAWRGGGWSIVDHFGSAHQRQAIAALVTEETAPTTSQGLLARSANLLSRSKFERSTIGPLLDGQGE